MAKRVDANQAIIVNELRAARCSVVVTSNMGEGFPDLVVGKNKRNFLFEVKDPAKPPSKRKLTKDQAEFFESWKGQVHQITTTEQALQIMRGFCR